MKMLELKDNTCPYCNKDVVKHIRNYHNLIGVTDIERVFDGKSTDGKYGIQARWKDVYICPYCGNKFYNIVNIKYYIMKKENS